MSSPAHTVLGPALVHSAVGSGVTDIVVALDAISIQAPLCTIALYCVSTVKLVKLMNVSVPAMSVQDVPPFVLYSQLTTDPVSPSNSITPALSPKHTLASAEVVPPTVAGLTVIEVSISNSYIQFANPGTVFCVVFTIESSEMLPATTPLAEVMLTTLEPLPFTLPDVPSTV